MRDRRSPGRPPARPPDRALVRLSARPPRPGSDQVRVSAANACEVRQAALAVRLRESLPQLNALREGAARARVSA